MNGLIVDSNKIKSRRYNLLINEEIVEEFLTRKMALILRNEYRSEGFAVSIAETFSVTKGMKIVGENPVENVPDANAKYTPSTATATKNKINKDRNEAHAKAEGLAAKKNRESTSIRYTGYGRDKNSKLHGMYLDNLKRNGYRVVVKATNEVWIGLQKDIAERIYNFIKSGNSKNDLDIKFLGAK